MNKTRLVEPVGKNPIAKAPAGTTSEGLSADHIEIDDVHGAARTGPSNHHHLGDPGLVSGIFSVDAASLIEGD